MPPSATIAGIEVKLDGQALDPEVAAKLLEVRVEDHLQLPDSFVIRIADPGLKLVDSLPFEVGKNVELSFGAPAGNRLVSLLKGQITSVEPHFAQSGAEIVARGLDASHQLNRTRQTDTYQNMTVGDIARRVAQRAGIEIGEIADTGGPMEFVQQNNQTDWEFLRTLAQRVGNEAVVSANEFHFRGAGGGSGGGGEVELRWGEELIEFHPRITGVQQVEDVVVRAWDHVAKRAIEATAKPEGITSAIGVARDTVVGALRGGTLRVANRPVGSQEEADTLAKSLANRVANAYVEAEGVANGNPAVRAGGKVKISGVGKRYGGTYTLTSTTHIFKGARGYRTKFTISGESERSLVDLLTPAQTKRWGNSVVLGIVTQNEDPEGLGRVRVRYPALDDDVEGAWARVVTPGAGKDKGLLMLPCVDDEVVVSFMHDDVRHPYVLGAVWNGKDKPPDDFVQTDGSFALTSEKKMIVNVKEEITWKGEKELSFEIGNAKITCKKDGSIDIEGQKVTIKGSGSVKVEASGNLDLKAGGIVKVSGSQIQLG
jgi:phage protein D/phage baseplate assembly protein gpV